MSTMLRLIFISMFLGLGCAGPTDSDIGDSPPAEVTSGLGSTGVVPAPALPPSKRTKPCCPYASGCSCLGIMICDASGSCGACEGASRAGQPCRPQ